MIKKIYLNIRERRKELGITQEDLAKRLGYADKSMISRIERGHIDLPESKIQEFAEVFGVSPAWLQGYTDKKNLDAAPATGTEDEDKEFILYKLFETLIETHEFCCDLRGLELVSDGDTVLAHFTNGSTTRINVACDSGIAMISDVIKALRRR